MTYTGCSQDKHLAQRHAGRRNGLNVGDDDDDDDDDEDDI